MMIEEESRDGAPPETGERPVLPTPSAQIRNVTRKATSMSNHTPAATPEPASNHSVNVTVNVNTDPTSVAPLPQRLSASVLGYVLLGVVVLGFIVGQMVVGGVITIAVP